MRARRVWAIWGIGLVAFALCAAQLFAVQIVRGPALAAQGRAVRTSATTLAAQRGSIVDAQGLVLAQSVERYHIAVNQRNILDYRHVERRRGADGTVVRRVVGAGPAEAARQLAPLLHIDQAQLGGMMLGRQTYRYLKKNVDVQTYRRIRALDIYGIEWEPAFQRKYPAGPTAATVIGTVDAQGAGSAGLELTQGAHLTGTPGQAAYEISPTGEVIPGGKQVQKPAVNGATVRTTVHADLQHQVQENLDAAVRAYSADWGAVVILDVATSRVLVLADSGEKAPSSTPQTSRAVQYAFEPGSVGKVLTAATALEQGAITPLSAFTVPYTYRTPNGQVFHDFHAHATQRRTTTGILAESSNTGSVQIGERVSDRSRFQMMRTMGLGSRTGIELPGESGGRLGDPQSWDGRTRYATMFGQGYSLTALQEASLFATIGNGGIYQAPRIVQGVQRAGGAVSAASAPAPRRAVSAGTAAKLIRMLESTTAAQDGGTAAEAAVAGYRTAVKTGTAQIIAPDGTTTGTVSQVAGLLPADAPRLAISVVLYNPRVGQISSESAVPLFHQVASEAVRNLGIPASGSRARLYPIEP